MVRDKERQREYHRKWYARNRAARMVEMRARHERCIKEDPVAYRRLLMFQGARARAERKGVPFTITIDDVGAPTHCPAVGVKLNWQNRKRSAPDSPTLDRLVPELGYVPGNVTVLSSRANSIKSDATPREVALVSKWMRKNVNND